MPSRLIQQPRFQLVDLISYALASVLWCTLGKGAWWPLLIALAPWLMRSVLGVFPFQRTPFDLALFLFLLSAGIGIWVAYDPDAAWGKFWVIVASFFGYYALVRQPRENFWILTGCLGFLGVLIAVSFLLLHDWTSQPADFEVLNQIGSVWMSVRPQMSGGELPPNQTGGILAILLPFQVAFGWYIWKQPKVIQWSWALRVLVLTAFTLILAGLLMTSSRAAWLASLAAFIMWLFWPMSQVVARKIKQSPGKIFFGMILLVVVILGGIVITHPYQIIRLVDQLPGYPSGESRFELAKNTLYLIADFPFTGGGLDNFAGLYSQYILVIPHFFFGYSHNLLLDITIQQGLLGLFTLIFVVLGSAYLLLRNFRSLEQDAREHIIRQAILVSVVIMLFHGLLDDALYGNQGTPLLFLTAGMAVAIWLPINNGDLIINVPVSNSSGAPAWKQYGGFGLISLVIVLAIGLLNTRNLKSIWIANRGAVQMARVQLRDFPSGEWENGEILPDLTLARRDFDASLILNPDNRIANYRQGVVSMLEQDFTTAEVYLVKALMQNMDHRGVKKNLGYCYVWLGEFDKAQIYLAQIPEAKQELDAYTWWWDYQGRQDLARRAQRMRKRLDG